MRPEPALDAGEVRWSTGDASAMPGHRVVKHRTGRTAVRPARYLSCNRDKVRAAPALRAAAVRL